MLDSSRREILEDNSFLTERRNTKKKRKFRLWRFWLIFAGIVVGFGLLAGFYFYSDFSKVYHISIEGNTCYSDEHIRSLSKVKESDIFLFVSLNDIEKNLEKDEIIESATAEKLKGNLIRITVKEYDIVGYTFESGLSCLVLGNGEMVELDEDNMSLISRVPLIEGYDYDSLQILAEAFSSADASIIEEISEIHHYPMSYDENMMELIMKDGNYCFVSFYGIDLLKNYYSVVSELELNKDKACLLVDEVTNTYQYRKCPWETVAEVKENTDE